MIDRVIVVTFMQRTHVQTHPRAPNDRSGAASYNYDVPSASYTLKWTFHNELGIVFVAVYQKILHLLYVDDLLAMVKRATWCVCKKGGQDKVLQEAIDYACGNGADCTQTHQGGKCFNPDTVMDHCNYAVNSYFQNKGQTPEACVFKGATMVTTTDPSSNGCTYPTSAGGTMGSTSPGTNTHSPGSTPTSSFGNNPSNTGVLGGGMGGSLGPSASSMDTDISQGLCQQINIFGVLAILGAGIMMLTY